MPVKEILGNQIRELVYIFVLLLATSNASKEILKQVSGSTDQSSKKWDHEDQTVCGLRWQQKIEDGKVLYATCRSVTTSNKPCNLRTENWLIPADVNSVFIEVGGTWHNCTKCTSYFDLIVKFPASYNSYEQIMKLPQKTKLKNNNFFSYDDSIEVHVKGYRNMTVKFRTTYFCGDIRKVRLYYLKCPTSSKELVTFSSKPAPSGSNNLTIQGSCTTASDPDPSNQASEPYMICRSSGNSIIYGKCLCKAGHFPKNNECKECASNEFKSSVGNIGCKKCGKNSSSEKTGKIKCACKKSHYRETGKEENYEENCYRLPDAPSNVIIKDGPNDKANISWSEPAHGSAPLGQYFIDCLNCPVDERTFPVNTSDTFISLTGLKPAASYELQIYNKNSITRLVTNEDYWNKENFYLNTSSGGKPGRIQQLEHVVNDNYTVTLTWKPPFYKGGKDLLYEIHYGKQIHETKDTKWTIETGTEDKIYIVKIFATAVVKGIRVRGDPVNSPEITVKGGIPLTLTIAVAASVIVLVILVLLASFCVWKKRHPSYLQVVRMENGAVQLPNKFFSHGKLYVDPTTYNAVDEAVQEFAKEIDRRDLTVGELLGGGEFAEVFKGLLYRNGASKDVAIKTLKSGVVSKRDRDDFFGEAAILGQFSDCTNVVKLEGVILKDRPNLIILEYMKNGALDSYLQKNDNKFDVTQLLGMARCVANGMTYLSEIGFIHRDLAARNILVDEFNVCKVSDFGMSREIKLDDTYDTQGGKIPVRWTAPEAIQYKKFTSASDIWSYGILLWEIMSFGERPYWDWGNYTVLERLNAGYRLPPPMNCPKVIHDLMLKCWHKDRTKRPKFKEIGDQIEQWIRTPLLLRGVAATVVRKRDENLDYTVLETINKWLEAIGMDRYTETFLTNGYSTPRQVLNLTMDDLEKLEIGPIGHKKKIYKAIQNTKEQVESRHNSSSEKTVKKYNLPTFKK